MKKPIVLATMNIPAGIAGPGDAIVSRWQTSKSGIKPKDYRIAKASLALHEHRKRKDTRTPGQIATSEGLKLWWKKRKREKRQKPEQILHKAVADYLGYALQPPTIWTTIGHGGGGKVRGAILKGLGVQPGWPDVLILHPSSMAYVQSNIAPPGKNIKWGPWHYCATTVLGIELKSKTGSLSKEQKEIAAAFAAVGGSISRCRSIDDVANALSFWGVPHRARVGGAA